MSETQASEQSNGRVKVPVREILAVIAALAIFVSFLVRDALASRDGLLQQNASLQGRLFDQQQSLAATQLRTASILDRIEERQRADHGEMLRILRRR